MTVCIAAASIANDDPLIVFCLDLKVSLEYSSAETASKWRTLAHGFYALVSGPLSPARELASACHSSLERESAPETMAQVIKRLRRGVGLYKRRFAEAYIYKHLGMSYHAFQKTGKTTLPDDVFRQITTEIKDYIPANVELIVAGFLSGNPVIFKVSYNDVSSWDDFAVIGSGTLLGEAALLNREQQLMYGLNRTLYNIYEAKRLAERADGVGKNTRMFVVRPQPPNLQVITSPGMILLEEYFQVFGPQSVQMLEFPATAFQSLVRQSARQTADVPKADS